MVKGDRSHGKPTSYKDIIDILINDNWNADVARITIHNHIDDEVGEYGWSLYEPKYYYETFIFPVVEYLIKNGFYVIIDCHVGAYLSYDNSSQAEEVMVPFWHFMCNTELLNHPQVIFELFNEPHSAPWNVWQKIAQPWVDAIRTGDWSKYDLPKTTPSENILLISGPSWAQVLPMNENEHFFHGTNIAYTCHIYPAHCLENNRVPDWFEYTVKHAPVFLTEWGYVRDDVKSTGPSSRIPENFQNMFRTYVDSFPNVSWTAWCFDYVYRPYMFDINWQLLGNGNSERKDMFWDELSSCGKKFKTFPDSYDNYMGQFVKDWLNGVPNR
jgi:hypothetical protein